LRESLTYSARKVKPMAKLTNSEWFIFLLNIAIALAMIIGITWAVITSPKSCWQDNATETTNLENCEEH